MKKLLGLLFGVLFSIPAISATLPSGYTELEYIESTGTQYIDTGVTGFNTGSWEIYAKWMLPVATQPKEYANVFSVYAGEDYNSYRVITKQKDSSAYYVSGNSKAGGGSVALSDRAINQIHTAIARNGSVIFDGETITTSTKGTALPSDASLGIFAKSDGNGKIIARIYSVNVKKDGALVADYVPVRRVSDGVIGMYNVLDSNPETAFYGNAGTGEFTGGDPVANTCPNGGTLQTYVSATGTVVQNGTPTPTNPITPTFYTQGNMVLRKVGDYADSYDASTGKITRRVAVVVFDGTESWAAKTPGWEHNLQDAKTGTDGLMLSHFGFLQSGGWADVPVYYAKRSGTIFRINYPEATTAAELKSWLAAQYNAGTPVTVWYPLAEPVEETWTEESYCRPSIKIATRAYNTTQFAPVVTALNTAVDTIKDVVTNTINQTAAVSALQSTKQTMPDAAATNGTCPQYKQCLLVETEDGTPQWFVITDPFRDFFDSYTKDISATSLDSDKFPPTFKSTQEGDKWTYYNAFYYGDKTWRETYIDGSNDTYDRPMDHATRCTSPSYKTDSRAARPCYSAGGMYKTLREGEWAVVYEGGETSGPNVAVPGVIYGTSKCTSVGGTNNYTTLNPTKLSELSAANQEKWTRIPNAYGTEDDPNNPRSNYKYCWCQATSLGMPSASGEARDGAIYSLPSAGPWVFRSARTSAAGCAYDCADRCAYDVRANAGFRRALLGGAAN